LVLQHRKITKNPIPKQEDSLTQIRPEI